MKIGKPRLFNKEQQLIIVEMYLKEKMNMLEIAKIMNCSPRPIKKILQENKINTKLNGNVKTVSHRIKLSNNSKINPNYGMKGKRLSKESIEKIRISKLGKKRLDMAGKNNYWYGRKKPEHLMKFYRERRANQVFPIKDSSIEVKMQNYLKLLGIEFFTHQKMSIKHSYQCDILIPSMNLVIECDGDYWHGNPEKYPNLTEKQRIQRENDNYRTIELISKGFKVLRLWEHEIKSMSLDNLKQRLQNG